MLTLAFVGVVAVAAITGSVWHLSVGTPCPECHGLGASQDAWDRSGFGGPSVAERCERCAGTGRLPR